MITQISLSFPLRLAQRESFYISSNIRWPVGLLSKAGYSEPRDSFADDARAQQRAAENRSLFHQHTASACLTGAAELLAIPTPMAGLAIYGATQGLSYCIIGATVTLLGLDGDPRTVDALNTISGLMNPLGLVAAPIVSVLLGPQYVDRTLDVTSTLYDGFSLANATAEAGLTGSARGSVDTFGYYLGFKGDLTSLDESYFGSSGGGAEGFEDGQGQGGFGSITPPAARSSEGGGYVSGFDNGMHSGGPRGGVSVGGGFGDQGGKGDNGLRQA